MRPQESVEEEEIQAQGFLGSQSPSRANFYILNDGFPTKIDNQPIGGDRGG